jgi:nicotinic acid mononucleotide adenylyltransferase
LTIDIAAEGEQSRSDVELRTYRIHNPAGDSAPLYLLPRLHEEISASEIRERIREQIRECEATPSDRPEFGGKLLPDAVLDYIRAHSLYR